MTPGAQVHKNNDLNRIFNDKKLKRYFLKTILNTHMILPFLTMEAKLYEDGMDVLIYFSIKS